MLSALRLEVAGSVLRLRERHHLWLCFCRKSFVCFFFFFDGQQIDQGVRHEDEGVGDVGHQEVSLRAYLFLPSQAGDSVFSPEVARAPPLLVGVGEVFKVTMTRRVLSDVTLLEDEGPILRKFPRPKAEEEDNFPDDAAELIHETVFALLEGDLDTSYSYPVAPARVESEAEMADEDARRWRASVSTTPNIRFRAPSMSIRLVPIAEALICVCGRYGDPGKRICFGPRHPVGPTGAYINLYSLAYPFPDWCCSTIRFSSPDASPSDPASEEFPLRHCVEGAVPQWGCCAKSFSFADWWR
ncbi:hypothetical protein Emed_006092 [Eimeria media]